MILPKVYLPLNHQHDQSEFDSYCFYRFIQLIVKFIVFYAHIFAVISSFIIIHQTIITWPMCPAEFFRALAEFCWAHAEFLLNILRMIGLMRYKIGFLSRYSSMNFYGISILPGKICLRNGILDFCRFAIFINFKYQHITFNYALVLGAYSCLKRWL